MIADQTYLSWQKRLAQSTWFRIFWKFWGLYAILTYGVLGYLFLSRPGGLRLFVTAALAALVMRFIVCEAFELFYRKPHPYQRLGFTPPGWWLFSLRDKEHDAFPSQHSSVTMVISGIIFAFYPGFGLVAMSASIMTGIGRVVIGYHEPADVVAGWAVGLLAAWVLVLFLGPAIIG